MKMSEKAAALLSCQMEELSSLIETNPIYISVYDVAAFLHVKPEALRASMEQGRCPFGFSWKLGDKAAFKIPTVTFYSWVFKAQI